MASKNKKANPIENETVVVKDIIEEMETSSLNYAIKTITDRAIPDARDGLKPVLRRLLYAMHRKGLTPDKHYVKNADIVGDTMGKYHPHGDGSIYGVLVNASQPFNYRYPLIDFQGNNGSLDGDPPAAYRYTEGRLDKKALFTLADVDKETVDFKPNYAETTQEPVVLPSLFPNLLVNGGSGIATGYTTEIPSHNLGEVIDAIIAQIKNPEITLDELLKHIKGPDFAIGGQLIVNDRVRELYRTGQASLRFRGTYKIEQPEETESGNAQIVFDSLPPDVNKPKLLEKLHEACIDKKIIPRVLEVRDESEGNEIRITLELHKTAIPEIVVSEVYDKTPLEKTKGYVMRALVDQAPKVLGLKTMIQFYIEHRRDVVTRRTKYDLKKAQDRLHLQEGFAKILANIDEVIAIIRGSDTTDEAAQKLMKRFSLDDVQTKAILDMPLRRLVKLEENKIVDIIKELQAEIAQYEVVLSGQLEVDKVIISELRELKKQFGDERRTQVVLESELGNHGSSVVSAISEDVVSILTTKNTIKQIPFNTYEEMAKTALRERTEVFVQGVKGYAEEFILVLSTGEYVKASFSDLINPADFIEDKKIVAIVKLEQDDSQNAIYAVTKLGHIIKSPMSGFRARQRRIAPFIKFKNVEDEIIAVRVYDNDDDNVITIATDQGVIHRFYNKSFGANNPGGSGVPCISTSIIEEGQEIVGFAINKGSEDEQHKIILYTEDTQGVGMKGMALTEFNVKGRVSKGTKGIEFRRGSGKVRKMKLTKEDFFLIDSKGLVYPQKLVSVVPQNRYNKPESFDFIPLVTDFFIN